MFRGMHDKDIEEIVEYEREKFDWGEWSGPGAFFILMVLYWLFT